MYKCKFTCGICGNHLEQDSGSTPPKWFRLYLKGTEGDLEMMVCKLCLPMPVTKSAVQGLLPTIRKKIANWCS